MPFLMIDFWQALAAGILVGSAYALMCVGLNIIFGAMRVINFAQGDFLMLGMYAAFYLTAGYGVLTFLGPYAGPIVAAFLAGPIVFAIGWLVHKLHRFAGDRGRGRRDRGRRALRPDPRHAGHLADPDQWRADPVRLDPGRRAHAAVAAVVGDRRRFVEPGPLGELPCRDRGGGRGLSVSRPYAGRQGLARRRRQPAGGDLYGDRCRPGASGRLEPRGRRSPRSPAVSSRRFRPFSPISGSISSS